MHTACWWGKLTKSDHLEKNVQRWEYSIKMRHSAIKCHVMDSIVWAQEREMWRVYVKAVIDVQVPCSSGNLLTS
jgi:hypothetical protein